MDFSSKAKSSNIRDFIVTRIQYRYVAGKTFQPHDGHQHRRGNGKRLDLFRRGAAGRAVPALLLLRQMSSTPANDEEAPDGPEPPPPMAASVWSERERPPVDARRCSHSFWAHGHMGIVGILPLLRQIPYFHI